MPPPPWSSTPTISPGTVCRASQIAVSRQETDRDTAIWLARQTVPGEIVGVLLHGGGGMESYGVVADAGALLVAVRPYRSAAPVDVGPALRLLDAACVGDQVAEGSRAGAD